MVQNPFNGIERIEFLTEILENEHDKWNPFNGIESPEKVRRLGGGDQGESVQWN